MSASNDKTTNMRGARASDKNLLSSIERQVSARLSDVFKACLDSADEILFSESEKAENSNFQSTFLATMRDIRENRQDIEQKFIKQVGAAFQLVQLPRDNTSSDDVTKTVELSLVEEADFELTMAKDAIVNKCLRSNEAVIAVLDARFACAVGQWSLVNDEEVEQSELEYFNPISPARLRDFYVETISSSLETDLPVLIVLYKLYERELLSQSGSLFEGANALFLRSGVLKDYVPPCLAKEEVSQFKQREEQLAVEPPPAAEGSVPVNIDPAAIANIGAAMQSAMGIARGADIAGVSPVGHFFSGNLSPQSFPGLNVSPGEIQSINEIAQLLSMLPSVGYSGANQSAGFQSVGNAMNAINASESPTVGYDVLLQMLTKLQQETGRALRDQSEQADVSSPSDVLEHIAEQINAEGDAEANSIGKSERDTIGLVSMLFQFVIEDRVASKVMQRALGRLQLPIIKVALKDPRFFSKSDHPARKFLNSITSASVGWVEQDDYHSDPFYIKISEFIDHLIDDFEDDLEVFEAATRSLQEFLDKEEEKAVRTEARLLDMEEGRDRAEQARQQVEQFVSSKSALVADQFVGEMMRDHWSNYMLRLLLQNGEDSREYLDACRAIDTLIWTISDKRSRGDAKQILEVIPDTLKSLRTGFETLGMEVSRAGAFFRQLASRHKEVMSRQEAAHDRQSESVNDPLKEEDVEIQPSFANEAGLANVDRPQLSPGENEISPADGISAENAATEDTSIDLAQDKQPSTETETVSQPLNARQPQEASAEPEPELDEYEEKAASLGVGQWVEVIEEDDRLRCRLAAILRASGKRVFVNRRGVKAIDLIVAELAEKLRSETLILLDDGQLFDKALTSIIGDLRQQKRETVACSS